jgi:WD40 repeat protein
VATGSEDFTARIWDVPTGRELHLLRHGHKVIHVEISPDGAYLLTASYDTLVRVWDLRSGTLVTELKGHAAPLNDAAFSADSRRIVTACEDCTARLWRIEPEPPLLNPLGIELGLIAADMSPDGGSIVAAHVDLAGAQVLDLSSRREAVRLEPDHCEIRTLVYSFDGSKILGGCKDGAARLWDARTGQLLHTLPGPPEPIVLSSFSADDRLALTVAGRTARVWDVRTGEPAATLSCEQAIAAAALDPAGERVFLADASWEARIVDLTSGESLALGQNRLGFVQSADFGPEGRTLVTTSATTRVHIRSLPDGKVLATLVHPSRVTYAVCSPDKRWIAAGATDSTLRIWNATTREKWLEIKNVGYFGARASFTSNAGSVMVAWAHEGERFVHFMQLGVYPLDVLAAARRASFGDLTPDERDHFQVGSSEDRRAHREAWQGGHIYGTGAKGDE